MKASKLITEGQSETTKCSLLSNTLLVNIESIDSFLKIKSNDAADDQRQLPNRKVKDSVSLYGEGSNSPNPISEHISAAVSLI